MLGLKKIIAELHEHYVECSRFIKLTEKEEQTFSSIDPTKSAKLLFVERADIAVLVKRLKKSKEIDIWKISRLLQCYTSYLHTIRMKHKVHLSAFGPFLPSDSSIKQWRRGGAEQNLRFYDRAIFLTLLWSVGPAFVLSVAHEDIELFRYLCLGLLPFTIWVFFKNHKPEPYRDFSNYSYSDKQIWKTYKCSVIEYLQQTNLIYKYHKIWDNNEELSCKKSALLLTDKNNNSSYLYPNDRYKEELKGESPSLNKNVLRNKSKEISNLLEGLKS